MSSELCDLRSTVALLSDRLYFEYCMNNSELPYIGLFCASGNFGGFALK